MVEEDKDEKGEYASEEQQALVHEQPGQIRSNYATEFVVVDEDKDEKGEHVSEEQQAPVHLQPAQ